MPTAHTPKLLVLLILLAVDALPAVDEPPALPR